jgi:hypothetical protein
MWSGMKRYLSFVRLLADAKARLLMQ